MYDEYRTEILKPFNGEKPDIILCKNYSTPQIYKTLFDTSTIVYLIAGSRSITDILNDKDNIQFVNIKKNPTKYKLVKSEQESNSVDSADFIFGNSIYCCESFNFVFPEKKQN